MKRFKSKFAFNCSATKADKAKKTIVTLVTNLNKDEVKELVDYFNEPVRVAFIKEHEVEKYDNGELEPEAYGFTLDSANPHTGAKGNDTYSIVLSRLLNVKEHIELDDFLMQSVVIEIEKVQPAIDFKEKEKPVEKADDLDDFQDVETPKDAGFEDDDE